jgi:DNA-binding GntR family transcriptional regulator
MSTLAASRRGPAALPSLKPVAQSTLRDQVTRTVRTALMTGQLQPGQPITVKAISSMVGVSVMPCREAMNRLIAEGALELRPNRSVMVPVLSLEELGELTQLRCHIEGMAAAQAVRHVTPASLETLRWLESAMRTSARRGRIDEYLTRNFEFHFSLYRLGASKFLLSIIESTWVRVGPLIRSCLDPAGFSEASRLHQEIILGLEQKRPAAVRSAISADIAGAAEGIRAAQAADAPARTGGRKR